MKIGVITSVYPEYEGDSHGIFVHRLMREVIKHGHEVYVLAPYAGGKTKYNLEGVNVKKFNYFYPKKLQRLAGRSGMIDNVKEGFFVKIQVLSFLFFNIFYSLKNLRDMDIIHVQWPVPNGLGALFLKKIYGFPYINTIHGEEVHLSKRYHLLFGLRWLVKNSEKTITNSSATRNFCLEAGLPKEKLKIIPFGVDTEFFRPLGLPKDDKVFQILSVGYLIERKGFEYLIKAIKEIKKEYSQVKLKIVGIGPLEDKLKILINELNLEKEAEIVKNVSDEELLHLYNTSDLFVLPSIVDSQGNTEGLGVVLLEAMACGLLVMGSNVGGIPDIIEDGVTGILVKEKDIIGISKSISFIMKNKSLCMMISKKGYKYVQRRFTWKRISEDYIKLITAK